DQQTITVVPDVDPGWTPPTTLCDYSPPFDLNTTITGTAGGTWSGTGVTGNMFDPTVGSQTVTYTVGTAPCVETMALMINVGTTPNPAWTTFTMCAFDAPVNMNTTVTGTAGGTWSGTGISGSVFDPFFGTQNITYTVVNGSCSASSSQPVTVIDPQLTTSVTNVSCNGLNDGSANVTVTGGSGAYNYSWSTTPAQTTSTASNVPAGTYTVTVTDGSCVVTSNVTVIEPDSLFAVLTAVNRCTPYLGSATANPYGG